MYIKESHFTLNIFICSNWFEKIELYQQLSLRLDIKSFKYLRTQCWLGNGDNTSWNRQHWLNIIDKKAIFRFSIGINIHV